MSDTNPIEVMKNLERKVDELEVENKILRKRIAWFLSKETQEHRTNKLREATNE